MHIDEDYEHSSDLQDSNTHFYDDILEKANSTREIHDRNDYEVQNYLNDGEEFESKAYDSDFNLNKSLGDSSLEHDDFLDNIHRISVEEAVKE
jgi:hypothetical protein